MITLDDIRRRATAFADVEKFTHFRLRVPGFKVWAKAVAVDRATYRRARLAEQGL